MDRESILAAVRETATANGGIALGRLRLEAEAGVKEHHWRKFWARYGDLVREAGLEPQAFIAATPEFELSAAIVALARELGRFPTGGDLRARRAYDDSFPSSGVFERIGGKADIVAMVARYCSEHGMEDVAAMCEEAAPKTKPQVGANAANADGFVYLLKSGRSHKIGRSVHAGARERQLAIQLPDPAALIHTIRTDDPVGIEAYWHHRFAAKRKNGEWFDLSREDVAAFRRRKFM